MKLIEVITDQQNLKSITRIAEQHCSEINWVGPPDEQDRQLIRLLVGDKNLQLVSYIFIFVRFFVFTMKLYSYEITQLEIVLIAE